MKPLVLVALLGSLPVALLATGHRPSATATADDAPVAGVVDQHYPDFGFLPARSLYEGRVFKLSQNYPKALPRAAVLPDICKGDFEAVKRDWRKYLLAVRDYCFEGNIGNDDFEDDWRVENNKNRRWYHVPWQHFGPSGREGIHGLTKEAPVLPRQLAWTQTHTGGQTYAVGFYNEFGGYTIGQVFANETIPGRWNRPPVPGTGRT